MTPVVFDLDGTLTDSLPDVAHAANALLADEGATAVAPGTVAGFVGWGEGIFIDRLIAHAGLDPAARDSLLDRFIGHYTAAGDRTRLMPGVAEALSGLKDMGVPMGLCTNKPRAPLLPVLETSGLGDWITVVVAGDDLARRKPAPEPLLAVLRALDAPRAIYIGDSIVDAQTARAAGVPFALYTEGIRTDPVAAIPHDAAFADFALLGGLYDRLR